ncbi:long-chain fatty acid transporter fat1 [Lecanora helva]
MAIPLAAGSAALAGAAWLTAKTQLDYDYNLITGLVGAHFKISIKEKRNTVNLFNTLEQHATNKTRASHPFLVYQEKSWTFKEAYHIVLQYGTWLKDTHAVAPKEVVAMDFMNSPQFVFLWLGLWSIGAVPAFINYNLTGAPLLHTIKSSTSRLVIVDPEVKAQFTPEVTDTLASHEARDGKGPIRVVDLDAVTEQHILSLKGVREPDQSRSAMRLDLALLIYTSGTTGLPKPGFVSWQKLHLLTGFVPKWLGLKKSDRYYTCMPLYHSSAAFLALCTSLVASNTLVLGHRFSTKTFWPEVRQSKATVIQYVGETCRYLLAAPPQIDPVIGENLDAANAVTKAFGNGLRPDVWERFKTRFGIDTIAEFYGATEGVSALWNLSSNQFASGAIGRNGFLSSLLANTQSATVAVDWTTELPLRSGKDNFCQRVPRGEPGELMFKVPPEDVFSKFQGYFNNKGATDSKVMRDVLVKGDAYVRSGDVVRWDKEGRWWFCDRIGDTFRWKSENVSTAEVSDVLGSHPKVHEANVYGVEVPHHDGRAGCAAVLLEGGIVNDDILETLAKHATKGLPKYSVPVFLRVVTEHETTGNNKQQKAALRNEGVDPVKVRGEKIYWLREGKYVAFEEGDWKSLSAGRVKL